MNLKGRHLLTLLDFTPEEIQYLVDLAARLKLEKKEGIQHKVLTDKNIVLLFQKDSTRTRCAFEVGAYDLGMHTTYLGPTGSQMEKKNLYEILLAFLVACSTALNLEAICKVMLKL